jgi:hypothetical protein
MGGREGIRGQVQDFPVGSLYLHISSYLHIPLLTPVINVNPLPIARPAGRPVQ